VFIALMGLIWVVSYGSFARTREIIYSKSSFGATQGMCSSFIMDFLKLLGVSAVLAIGFRNMAFQILLGAFANRTRWTILAISNPYFIGHAFSYS